MATIKSIEEKAKAYDEVVSKLKGFMMQGVDPLITRNDVQDFFPELKESEDKKPNGAIVMEDFNEGNGFYKVNLAYLNKEQVEDIENIIKRWNVQKYNEEAIRDCIGVILTDASEQRFVDFNTSLKDCLAWLENQGEQTLANSAKTCKDEQNTVVVIPKFRVGDVIRPKGSTAEYTIESISGECYHGKGWGLHISCDDDYELVEQKPADEVGNYDHKEVLQTIINEQKPAWSEEDELHIRELESLVKQVWATAEHKNDKDTIHKMSDLSFFLKTLKPQQKQEWRQDNVEELTEFEAAMLHIGESFFGKNHGLNSNDTSVVKEQAMLLLEFVANKPAWSEEDEENNKNILYILNQLKGTAIYKEDKTAENCIDWLKSLKEKYRWKPSDEQLEALEHSLGDYNITIFEDRFEMLKSLYQDLKKLKG